MARGRLRRRPVILSHLVTGRCNACCPTCLWRDQESDELTAAEVAWLYRQAAAMGIAQVVVWGGEPLLRADIAELLGEARHAGLVVTLITNGWLLSERWDDVRGLVDALIVSLDDAGPAHDRLRGLPGLFGRLDGFMVRVADDPLRPTVLINTVLSRLNPGALRRVAPVARRWHAGLYFCPMETGQMQIGGFDAALADLALSPRQLVEAADLARELQAAGYPLLASTLYLRLLARDPGLTDYSCRAPRAILTVEADGSVRDCLRRDVPLTAVRDLMERGLDLRSVLELARYREMLVEAGACTACNNPDAVELSWLWDLRPAMVRKAGRLLGGGAAARRRRG